jgi:predicted extracellular nuclease
MPALLVRRFGTLAVAALLVVGLLPAAASPVRAVSPTDLFFSEYIEGSSNNKALEIYNGTGVAVDLAAGGYSVQMFFNGNPAAGLTFNLTGTVANGDVFVVAQSGANATILAQADQTNGAGWFNGDDAVVLRKGTTIVDAIGQIGVDPGSEWGTGLTSTADNTLRRKAAITAGDTNGSDAFDPSTEWDGYATDASDGLGTHAIAPPPPPPAPVINEFSASTTGTDVEYVEIYGSPSTDYGAYMALEIEGDSGAAVGTIDEVILLGTTDANGLYLVNLPANALENGTITLLLVKDFTGALNTDLDTDNDGVFDVTPWDAIVDSVAVNDGGAGDVTYGVPSLGVAYDGLTFAPGGASRIPDGVDTDTSADWVRNDFDLAGIPGFDGSPVVGEAYNTPGAANRVVQVDPCTLAYTPIYAIQGSGSAAAITGAVTTQGVVVGDYEGASPTLRGFYLQDATGDGDPATSDGIFVFNGSANSVGLGDVVRVAGSAAEFQGQTQISSVTSIASCGTGTVAPVDVTFPIPSADYLERYEGMLVRLPQTMYVTEHFQLGRFGQVVLSSGARLSQPTNVVDPGTDAIALQGQNNLNRIIVDDDLQNQNRDPILFGRGGNPLSASNTLRGGDTATGIVGVMTYTWSGNAASGNAYRVRPVNALGGGVPDFEPANPRPEAAPAVGGTLTVVGMNLLNYFNTFDGIPDTVDNCTNGVGGSATDCRGADTTAEFERQHAKTIAALLALDADVVGFTELENDGYGPESALADLVDRMNAATAPGTYALIDPDAATGQVNALGLDAIKVGLVYKPATVTPVGQTAALNGEAFVNGGDTVFRNRPALAQAFEENTTGARFVAVVNHLKSKGSCPELATDPNADQLDGQSCWNLVRVNAATELMAWLATDPTGASDADVILVGDYNSYAMEDPIGVIKDAGYTNLIASFLGQDAYSYVFDGQWGYLDHALGSASLISQVAGVGAYHINADEPSVLDYNTDFKTLNLQATLYAPDEFRVSDHDPVVVGLDPARFEFTGFYQPIAAAPALNAAKAGQSIPVKFSLDGYQGLDIFSAGFPRSVMVDCNSLAPAGATETATAGNSSLAYNATTDTYTYVWKTDRSWAGTCRQLVVQLTDGSIHTALFRFRR